MPYDRRGSAMSSLPGRAAVRHRAVGFLLADGQFPLQQTNVLNVLKRSAGHIIQPSLPNIGFYHKVVNDYEIEAHTPQVLSRTFATKTLTFHFTEIFCGIAQGFCDAP